MSIKVMIVDDSVAMRRVIKKIITLSGYEIDLCIEAENGLEALEQLKDNRVDLIITGVNMPRMNGLALLRVLSQDLFNHNIPTIIVSTDASGEQITESVNMGARGFIKKPFCPEEIRKVLHDVLGVPNNEECPDDQRDVDGSDF